MESGSLPEVPAVPLACELPARPKLPQAIATPKLFIGRLCLEGTASSISLIVLMVRIVPGQAI